MDADDLLRGARHGVLATLRDGHPYASLVACAATATGSPLFLLSDLAEHTRNLRVDARASLLLAAADSAVTDLLAAARATFLGRCVETAEQTDRDAYLAGHPEAARYLAMKDFHFWRLEVASVRTIGGFGSMSWTPT